MPDKSISLDDYARLWHQRFINDEMARPSPAAVMGDVKDVERKNPPSLLNLLLSKINSGPGPYPNDPDWRPTPLGEGESAWSLMMRKMGGIP